MDDQHEDMTAHGRRRGLRIGLVAPAALSAVLLALTLLSGCSVVVVNSPRNPFVGEWHTEFTSAGSRFSAEYEFFGNGRYTYDRHSAGGVFEIIVATQGTYRYDEETLTLTPDVSDVDPSRFEYVFPSDSELRLREQISPSITLVLTYHRHE